MNLLPPSMRYFGDRTKSIGLKSQGQQFYNFLYSNALAEGVSRKSATKILDDGTVISARVTKLANFDNWSGSVSIFTKISENIKYTTNDFFCTHLDVDTNDPYIYLNGISNPELRTGFLVGQKYWIERDTGIGKRVVLSVDNGKIYNGGLESTTNINSSSVCYSRTLDKVINVTGSTSPSINIYTYSQVSPTSFELTLESSRSIPKNGNTNLQALGFLDDGLTLIVEGYSSVLRDNQNLNKYIFSKDYSTEVIETVWSGGRSEKVLEQNVGTAPTVTQNNPLPSDVERFVRVRSSSNKESLVRYFIYQDTFDAVFYRQNSFSYNREKTTVYSARDNPPGSGLSPGQLTYLMNTDGLSDISLSDSYIIRSLSANTGFIVTNTIDNIRISSGSSSSHQTAASGNTTDVHLEDSASHLFQWKVPIYVNSKLNIEVDRVSSVSQSHNIISELSNPSPIVTSATYSSEISSSIVHSSLGILSSFSFSSDAPGVLGGSVTGGCPDNGLTGSVFEPSSGLLIYTEKLSDLVSNYGPGCPYINVHNTGTTKDSPYAHDEKTLLLPYTLHDITDYSSVYYDTLISNGSGYLLEGRRLDSSNSDASDLPISVTSLQYLFKD